MAFVLISSMILSLFSTADILTESYRITRAFNRSGATPAVRSTIQPCMEYCFHAWTVAPRYYLELLDKLQQQTYRTAVASFAASLKPLAHCQNVAS